MAVFIYILIDPRSGIIRYVGKSIDPVNRLKNHIKECRRNNTHCANWIASLTQHGLLPKMVVVEEVSNGQWQEAERRWIAFYRCHERAKLTNITSGGDGVDNLSDDGRRRLREGAQKGAKTLREKLGEDGWIAHLKSMSDQGVAVLRSNPVIEEKRKRNARAATQTPEFAEKTRQLHTGRKISEQTRKKMCKAQSVLNSQPERKAHIGATSLKRFSNPEWKSQWAQLHAEAHSSEEFRKRCSESRRKTIAAREAKEEEFLSQLTASSNLFGLHPRS